MQHWTQWTVPSTKSEQKIMVNDSSAMLKCVMMENYNSHEIVKITLSSL